MATSKTVAQVKSSTNYRMFKRSIENRTLNPQGHKALYNSMKKYGFLKTHPISVMKNCEGYIVKEGQHRLAFAEELGLPVYYIVSDVDFDIAQINSAAKSWKTRDYADKWAACGHQDYVIGIEFHEKHKIPIGLAFALLAGVGSYNVIKNKFESGEFTVKDYTTAETVAELYVFITSLNREVKNHRLAEALVSSARVEGFDIERLKCNAKRCRDMLVPYSTKMAYLEMLEKIYNFGRKAKIPLKFMASESDAEE